MFKNTSIRVRLALAMGFLSALLIVVGVMGIVGVAMSNSDVQELYSSRLASSQALNRASVSLARARLWLFRIALDPTGSGVPQQAQAARDLVVVSKKAWEQYRALPFSGPDETSRATDVNSKFEKLLSGGLEPMLNAVSAHDSAKLTDVALHTPASMFIDVTDGMDALTAMQVSAAKARFDAAQARFHWFVGVAVAGILIALGAAMMAWWTLQRAIGEPLARTLDHFNAIASGDLTTRVEVQTSDEMGRLMAGLQTMQRKLVQTIDVVRDGSRSIDIAAQEISAGNLDLSQRTEEQAASLEETASSMEELTSTVRQNADNAKQASQVVRSTALLTEQGSLAAQEVVQTMRSLSDASGKIADITSVIEGIAFQTNILSLNAAVEAARAGEQGRGFAVVASEVRSLAQRSATASREIKELITDSLNRVETGARQADRATGTMADILASVRKVSDLMGEIAAASEEQSKGIEQVNSAVVQMDQVTQQNAALVEQASAAALSLKEQAGQLDNAVSVFRVHAS
ncbi:methyl-accepting chemotaxis protein [Paraburkholderia kirstenboschensis]|uniref:Methyl-accepting chemotaxis protein n=1 Tax=Paraburkholderia kirstenboschensis TaxID=1245436 RepID=A0ABZ0EBX1_9BURK|nr:methyl-accepting chemotaxis protein [Paraburkholderia kirstenboschensis]WOD13742.1 methyl-accepting chemotaxis protein [Paraburkholderia kirstenboschensis]